MTRINIFKKLKLLEKSIYDDLLNKIKELNLDDETMEKIEQFSVKPNIKAPVTPLEKQCGKLTKKGEKCKIAICYKKTCWAHLTKEEYGVLNMNKKGCGECMHIA